MRMNEAGGCEARPYKRCIVAGFLAASTMTTGACVCDTIVPKRSPLGRRLPPAPISSGLLAMADDMWTVDVGDDDEWSVNVTDAEIKGGLAIGLGVKIEGTIGESNVILADEVEVRETEEDD
jgi:hypothetical protein